MTPKRQNATSHNSFKDTMLLQCTQVLNQLWDFFFQLWRPENPICKQQNGSGFLPSKQDINNVQKKKSNAALIHAFSSSKLFLCHDWIV
jgi:hypothetical protein